MLMPNMGVAILAVGQVVVTLVVLAVAGMGAVPVVGVAVAAGVEEARGAVVAAVGAGDGEDGAGDGEDGAAIMAAGIPPIITEDMAGMVAGTHTGGAIHTGAPIGPVGAGDGPCPMLMVAWRM
ncbi:hypothetical protein predicted by Glimmer/Critica [Acetobacter ghanensis]|uniref:Uncharacterized protein n=2 Tax=Acetobacter ghanensis TaxID=431306 RepID=A0A0U5BG98_9PROT|nr:hypothetical protein [Acetobacter ghanensis]NHO39979.1 hypothetical protein [Acetobacter ghanensis]CEF53922.1 hypothetical protein predicted by Glimmer/Critica [Acetobacter ghanensis]